LNFSHGAQRILQVESSARGSLNLLPAERRPEAVFFSVRELSESFSWRAQKTPAL
jgi:hypothetical protein